MARKKAAAPTLTVTVHRENYERARNSDSGGCLIADAIKAQGYTSVHVDVATIRFSDPKTGRRYTYLTPDAAQHMLLAFDQGWPAPAHQFTLRKPVRITLMRSNVKSNAQRREERIAELEAKIARGEELTKRERTSLTKMRQYQEHGPKVPRAERQGPATVDDDGVVVGGKHQAPGPPNPNLLRGRARVFGAKVAEPGMAFQAAVAEAAEQLVAEREAGSVQSGT